MDYDQMGRSFLEMSPQERHDRRMAWFVGEAYRQASNRAMMVKCERYYDQHQTDERRRRETEARGQTVVQYDQITPQIDWLLGTERRMRIDSKVTPRRVLDEQTTLDAENKTELLKWIDDTNRTGYHRSAAWDDAMKAGMGWLEIYAKRDEDGWTIGKKSVPWKHTLWDSLGLEKTGTENMRFFFRMKPVDLDVALAHWPMKRAELLKCATQGSDYQSLRTWMGVPGQMLDLDGLLGRLDREDELGGYSAPQDLFNARQRILLVECWSLEPFTGPNGYSVDDPVRLRPHVAVMTEFDTLWEGWSPYKHGKIPFVPYWAYCDKTTGLPYGPIKRLLDRQDALNKVMSRAYHDISVSGMRIEAGAIDTEVMTIEEIEAEEADPAGMAVYADGALGGGKVVDRKNTADAESHMAMADRLQQSMGASALVNRETVGGGAPGTSGTALGKREDQSTVQTAELYDGLLLAHTIEGELTLSEAEQYMGAPLTIPSKNAKGEPIAVALNQPQQDGSISNDITQQQARFVITEQPWRASLGQAQFESLMLVLKDLAGPAPQVVMALLDVVFEYADIPNKQQIVERIRSVTGQSAPDQRPTPQQLQAQAKQAQMADAQYQFQLMEMQSKIAKMQADIEKAKADGQQAYAKALQLASDTLVKNLEALGLAATVAMQSAANPALTPATDAIYASAGGQDKHPAAGAPLLHMPTSPAPTPVQPMPAAPPQPMAMMTPPRPAPLPYPGSN